jgi:hypothetical protein
MLCARPACEGVIVTPASLFELCVHASTSALPVRCCVACPRVVSVACRLFPCPQQIEATSLELPSFNFLHRYRSGSHFLDVAEKSTA